MPRPIVLVAETSSLGAALLGLLETEGYSVRSVPSVRAAQTVLRRPGSEGATLIVASNAWSSETVSRWTVGALGSRPLVLIGTRDAHQRSHGDLYVIHLPVRPAQLLSVVHRATSEPVMNRPALARSGSPRKESRSRRTGGSRE